MAYNTFIAIVLTIFFSYMIGSFPSSLVIGQIFYKIDVRDFGSGNLGGTNVGRVLGKKASFSVIGLDIFKTGLPIILTMVFTTLINKTGVNIYNFYYNESSHLEFYAYLSAIFVSLGHCYPIFAEFRGGKAFAPFVGVMLFTNYFVFILGLAFFFSIFFYKKIVSFSSIITASIMPFIALLLSLLYYFIPNVNPLALGSFYISNEMILAPDLSYFVMMFIFCSLIIYRHKENIIRLLHNEEKHTVFKKG